MSYNDWQALLEAGLIWRRGLSVTITALIPSFLLRKLWYLPRRVKAHLARTHIYVGLTSVVDGFSQQPGMCRLSLFTER
jgi:hypothetical protein